MCVAELAELLLLEFGILLRATYAQLQEMSVKFPSSSTAFSATAFSSEIFSLAGVAAEWPLVQQGIDHDNYVSQQRVIDEDGKARLRNLDYSSRVEAESQSKSKKIRRTFPMLLASSDIDKEEVDYAAESSALTPDKGRPRHEDNSQTPPGPDSRGKDTFFGTAFGSANANTCHKVKVWKSWQYSPVSSSCEPSPDTGRADSLHSPPKMPDNDNEMQVS